MSRAGFGLVHLRVAGPGKADAEVQFRAGLNVIAGASNTGKTFIFRCVDFLLGSSEPPPEIPESKGYDQVQLEISSRGKNYTLQRALGGGETLRYDGSISQADNLVVPLTLGSKHVKGDPNTVSAFLLGLCDLVGKEVRRNEQGEKASLTFRDISWLSLVDEQRIITKESPLLSGQYTELTKEKSVFGLFLTGTDDAAIIATEKSKERKARLRAELNLLEQLLADAEAQWNSFGFEVDSLQDRRSKTEAAIENSSTLVAALQSEIDELAAQRSRTWEWLQEIESRRLFLSEQIKRLRLLRENYHSDTARLQSALEAGIAFEQLPTGECPVCGHRASDEGEQSTIDARLVEFQQSCRAELSKIGVLAKGLDTSLGDLQNEDSELASEEGRQKAALTEANKRINGILQRRLESTDAKLTDLLSVQSRLVEAATVHREILSLRTRQQSVQAALKTKVPKQKLPPKVETRTAARFADVVAATLKRWKYPNLGTVSFDAGRFDLVIGDQNRGSMGKGYRALTHAAVIISLMRYCRAENLPHPGVVILDTPLNPFRGPDDPASEFLNQDVQNAFYEDLATDNSGDQMIVLENTEPPVPLRSKMNFLHFSGTKSKGRYGFFPV